MSNLRDRKKEKKYNVNYLVGTPMDVLLDEGLEFVGDTDKDRTLNMFDFSSIREMIQRFGTTYTPNQHETMYRYLLLCIKPEPEASGQ